MVFQSYENQPCVTTHKYAETSTLFDTVHSLLKPKNVLKSEFELFWSLREENMDLLPT